jgi:creatinine amidohydrolase
MAEGGMLVVLLPVGSVEPHGPHMALATDTVISSGACAVAAALLEERGYRVGIAPAIPYGVTECAAGFAGAVSVEPEAVVAFVQGVVRGYLKSGARHVCLVNNHLEPAQDRAIRTAAKGFSAEQASVACPLTRRWGRKLTDEYKSGQCHAGQYETSIVLACDPGLVDRGRMETLPEVPISLAEKLSAGIEDFVSMGLRDAYAGRPADATAEEGRATLEVLGEMIASEVDEALNES